MKMVRLVARTNGIQPLALWGDLLLLPTANCLLFFLLPLLARRLLTSYFFLPLLIKFNVLKTKFILLVIALGFSFSSTSLFAQKDKKKKPEPVFSSARMAEAERIFTEGEKFYILEDYTKALFYFQQV